jgi:hypothetical protein
VVSSCFEELRLDALRAPPRPPRPALRPRRAGALASSVIPPRSSSSEGDFPGTLSVPAAARASRSAAVPVVRAPTCAPTARRRPAPPGAELLLADIAAASAAENVTTSAARAEASDPPRPRAAASAPVRRRTGAASTCLCPGPSPAIPATQRRSAQAHFRDHRPGRFSLVQGAFERGSPVDASSAWSSGEVSGGANSFFLFPMPTSRRICSSFTSQRQPNRNHGGGSADAEARRRQELPEGGERSPFFALALWCMLIGTAAEHTPLCAIRDRSWRCTTAARSRRMARCAGVVRSGGVLAWMRAGTCAHCESCLHGSMRARARCWPHQEFDSSYKRNKPFRFTIGVGQVGLAAPREAAWPLNLFARVPRRRTLTPSLRAGHQGMG